MDITGDWFEVDETGWACSTGGRNAYKIYSENLNLGLRVIDDMLITRRTLTK
jgi:hypothetical protein